MRVTNSILSAGSLGRLQSNLQGIAAVQARISTGLRIAKSSDDPAGASAVMQTNTSLRALEQYRRNVGAAVTRLGAEEGAIGQLGDVLMRAKELGVSQGSATATSATRRAAAEELRQLRVSAIALGNTQYAGSYLFGGDFATEPPFDTAQPSPFLSLDPVSGLPRQPVGRQRIEVGPGQYVDGTRDGKQVFLDSRAFEALDAMITGLLTDDPVAIRAATAMVDEGIDGVQAQLGDVGARANQLDASAASLDVLQDNFEAYRAKLAEVDVEEEFTELTSRQAAYQAAMLATSKVSGMSLTDYLR
jgi:flagellar hook-associated protein 3 FlgL